MRNFNNGQEFTCDYTHDSGRMTTGRKVRVVEVQDTKSVLRVELLPGDASHNGTDEKQFRCFSEVGISNAHLIG